MLKGNDHLFDVYFSFSDNFYQQDLSSMNGVVCVFSLKNPSYPEYLCQAGSGVTAVDIHPGKIGTKI
jgi:hypothetical protein